MTHPDIIQMENFGQERPFPPYDKELEDIRADMAYEERRIRERENGEKTIKS